MFKRRLYDMFRNHALYQFLYKKKYKAREFQREFFIENFKVFNIVLVHGYDCFIMYMLLHTFVYGI